MKYLLESAKAILLAGCTPSLMDAAAYAVEKDSGVPSSKITGNEIIGVWSGGGEAGRAAEVLLFRPDGTGRERSIDLASGRSIEWTFAWHYEGRGLWAGQHLSYQEMRPIPSGQSQVAHEHRFNVRLHDDSLIREGGGIGGGKVRVFKRVE